MTPESADDPEATRRRLVFWIALGALSILCALYALVEFPKAFRLARPDVSLRRTGALERARELAGRLGWGPSGFRQAASFTADRELQTFVELVGGGRTAFAGLMAEGLVPPYRWLVRHFKEGEAEEVLVAFTPGGQPAGFRWRLPESAPGPRLTPDTARALAEATASEPPWNLDLAHLDLVSSQRVAQPGRTDHAFVYERRGHRLGEAPLRVRLSVSGDRLTGLNTYVEIPETFRRRHEEMRSANAAISAAGSLAMAVLYVLGGCGVGLFVLSRMGSVPWRLAVFRTAVVAALQVAAFVNATPLAWMQYDTALSAVGFGTELASRMLPQLLGMAVLLFVSFAAADGLSRLAFPAHPPPGYFWSPKAAGSLRVLGRTVGGYLLVPVLLAYEVAVYRLGQARLGWWAPPHSLFDLDLLATGLPWLGPIVASLHAGLWEEMLFRAVPLASAALLGRRFGGRRYWIAAALGLQALVFGAVHAGYATQPAWARTAELLLPSIGFGLLYLRFGLLPVIVLHFGYDVVWSSLPLFAVSAPGVWIDRTLLVLCALLPLWVVLLTHRRRGGLARLDPALQEGRDDPSPNHPRPLEPTPARSAPLSTPALVAVAGLGTLCWLWAFASAPGPPRLAVGRHEAVALARQALREDGVVLDSRWHAMPRVVSATADAHRYVWRLGGSGLFRELLGTHLPGPRWQVRFARFEGDLVARSEQYRVWIDVDGSVRRVRRDRPRRRHAALGERQARDLAAHGVRRAYGLEIGSLEEVSAVPVERRQGTDWTFTWAVPGPRRLARGSSRISVEIAGDQIRDAYRHLAVPEEWSRAERLRRVPFELLERLSILTLVGIELVGAVVAIVQWSRGRLQARVFVIAAGVLLTIQGVRLAAAWPELVARLSTARPFWHQAGAALTLGGLSLAVVAGVLALGFSLAVTVAARTPCSRAPRSGLPGAALGLAAAGIQPVLGRLFAAPPHWDGTYAAAALPWPWVGVAAEALHTFAIRVTLVLLFVTGLNLWTGRGRTRRRGATALALAIAGLATGGGALTLSHWLALVVVGGTGALAAYRLVLRDHPEHVPTAVAVMTVLDLGARCLDAPHPGARLGCAGGILLVAALAGLATRLIGGRPVHASPPGTQSSRGAGVLGQGSRARTGSVVGTPSPSTASRSISAAATR